MTFADSLGIRGFTASVGRALEAVNTVDDDLAANAAIVDFLMWWNAVHDLHKSKPGYQTAYEDRHIWGMTWGLVRARNAGVHDLLIVGKVSAEPRRRWPLDWDRGIFQHMYLWVEDVKDSPKLRTQYREEQRKSFSTHLAGKSVEATLSTVRDVIDSFVETHDLGNI